MAIRLPACADDSTKRYPRTLTEAFGPDARSACPIERSHRDAYTRADRAVAWLIAAVTLLLTVLSLAGQLPGGGA